MSIPSDLVIHYSTKAFQTRLAALTFVGAVLGADVVWKDALIRSDTLGIGLLLVVGSLAELNRRYTYSYLCACRAAARSDSPAQMWRDFTKMNEAPWSPKALEESQADGERPREDYRIAHSLISRGKDLLNWVKGKRRKKRLGNLVSRFLLSWGTYLPGIAAGLYLVWSKFDGNKIDTIRIVKLSAASFIAGALLTWWVVQARRSYNPERLLENSRNKQTGNKVKRRRARKLSEPTAR